MGYTRVKVFWSPALAEGARAGLPAKARDLEGRGSLAFQAADRQVGKTGRRILNVSRWNWMSKSKCLRSWAGHQNPPSR